MHTVIQLFITIFIPHFVYWISCWSADQNLLKLRATHKVLSRSDIDYTVFIFRMFYLEDGGRVVFSECLYLSTRPQWCNIHAVSSVCSVHRNILKSDSKLNPLNSELNPICYLLALLGAHHFLHVSRIRIKLLTFRLLMSYIYGAPILDVSRSHTTTQHGR